MRLLSRKKAVAHAVGSKNKSLQVNRRLAHVLTARTLTIGIGASSAPLSRRLQRPPEAAAHSVAADAVEAARALLEAEAEKEAKLASHQMHPSRLPRCKAS